MKKKFGLVGVGWRGEFYLRIARALPNEFEITSALIRDVNKHEEFYKKFGVKAVSSMDDMLIDKPDFVVVAVKRGFYADILLELFRKGIPVLCETPPGESLDELEKIWEGYQKYDAKVQVAEQYIFQPLYSAWHNAIHKGILGEVENINISSLHGYHAVSIIRKFLNTGFTNCKIFGKQYHFNVTKTCGREGMIFDGEVFSCPRNRVTIEFDDGKAAFFDFSDPAQYHSFIRTRQLTIQGVRGEIDDLTIRYLTAENIPVTQDLRRIDLGVYGNQEWSHFGIMLGEEFLYKSPFSTARFNDDELAVATCMLKMGEYLNTGEEFYPLREACQDTYISLAMNEAFSGKEIHTETKKWALRM